MMQLMVGTAREQAGKMGVGFDSYRLISDPELQRDAGLGLFPPDDEHLERERSARSGELQCRLWQCGQVGHANMAIRAVRWMC